MSAASSAAPDIHLIVTFEDESAPTQEVEARLKRTFENLRGSVGGMVVVARDSAEEAGLKSLCAEFGATLINAAADDGVGMLRNLGIEASKGDWLLFLKPGESLDERVDIGRLKETVKDAPSSAYALTILHGIDATTGQTTADPEGHCADPRGVLAGSETRLIRRSAELRFDSHGQARLPKGEQPAAADVHVRTPAFESMSEGGPADAAKGLYDSAQLAITAGDYRRAEELLREAISKMEGPSPLHGSSLRSLAFSLIHMQQSKKALKVLKEAAAYYPDFTDLYYLTGLAFYDMEEFGPALRNFEYCLTKKDAPAQYGGWQGVSGYRSMREIAEVYMSTGELAKAEDYFRSALEANPKDGYSMEGLGEALLSRVDPHAVAAELEAAADFGDKEVLTCAVDFFRRVGEHAISRLLQERLDALNPAKA